MRLKPRAPRKYDAWGLLWLYIARNFRVLTYFRVSFFTGLLSAACGALTFLFIGQALLGAGGRANIGGDYTSFLIIGMIFNQLYGTALRAPYDAIHRAYWSAQLESIVLSPAPLTLLVNGEVLWALLNSLVRVCLYVVLGFAFGMRLSVSATGLGVLAAAFAVGLVGALGLGLLSAATFSLLNAKGNTDPVQWGVSTLQSLITGIYFPVTVLPRWLQYIALGLPHTYALDAARRFMVPGYGGVTLPIHALCPGYPLALDFAALTILALLLYWLGRRMFQAGIARARKDGSLSRWT